MVRWIVFSLKEYEAKDELDLIRQLDQDCPPVYEEKAYKKKK